MYMESEVKIMQMAISFQNLSIEELTNIDGGYWGQATVEAVGTYANAAVEGAFVGMITTGTAQGMGMGAVGGMAVQAYKDVSYLSGRIFN